MKRLATLTYGIFCYALFFATFLYAIGFIGNLIVPKSIDSVPTVSLATALFINTLLPIFAIVALVANILSAWSHRRIGRLLFGIAGPCMVLATLYLFWTENWSTYMFYAGLVVMLTASIWDIASPPNKTCEVSTEMKT